jgi:transposase
MGLYCGIDLHATNSWLCVVDAAGKAQLEVRVPNRLEVVSSRLEPFREELVAVAVESTRNWYWLVDGLASAGYAMHLANPAAMKQYEGLKYSDDRHDARWIAEMLRLGILPTGYIYPRKTRPVRDLLRHRARLVRNRTARLLTMQNLLAHETGRNLVGNELKRFAISDLPALGLSRETNLVLSSSLEVIALLDEKILEIEKVVVRGVELKLLRRGIGKALGLTIRERRSPASARCNYVSYGRLSGPSDAATSARKGKPIGRTAIPTSPRRRRSLLVVQPAAHRFFERKRARTRSRGLSCALTRSPALATSSSRSARDRRDLPLPLGAQLRLLRPSRPDRATQQPAQERGSQSEERQSLPLLGLFGGGGVCSSLPARGTSLLRAQARPNERSRGLSCARSQGRPRLLLHPPRSSAVRPITAVSVLIWNRGRRPEKVLGPRAHSAEWRRSRSLLYELRGCAHAASPQGAGAGPRAGQPCDCPITLWTRPGTDDLLGQRNAVRGPARRNRPRLDPDEWLVRLPGGATPITRRSRKRDPQLERHTVRRAPTLVTENPYPLTRTPSMSGTSSAPRPVRDHPPARGSRRIARGSGRRSDPRRLRGLDPASEGSNPRIQPPSRVTWSTTR